MSGRCRDQQRGLKLFMLLTKDFKSAAYSLEVVLGVVVVVELVILLVESLLLLILIVLTVAFFGRPLPFKLPNPLGNSPNPTVVSFSLITAGLTGELFNCEAIGVELVEEEEQEELSLRVSFSFLGAGVESFGGVINKW